MSSTLGAATVTSPSKIPLPLSKITSPTHHQHSNFGSNFSSRIPRNVISPERKPEELAPISKSKPLSSATFSKKSSQSSANKSNDSITLEVASKVTQASNGNGETFSKRSNQGHAAKFKEKSSRPRTAKRSQSSSDIIMKAPRKSSLPNPITTSSSKIPLASSDHIKSRSSSESTSSSTTRTSPVRQIPSPRKISAPEGKTTSKSSEQIVMQSPLPISSRGDTNDIANVPKCSGSHDDSSSNSSRIPLPMRDSASPTKTLPTVGWSFSPERMLNSQQSRKPTSLSTSNLPSAKEQVTNGISVRPKKFEAFVMTGDRMISLAKTPANSEFKSIYHREMQQQQSENQNDPKFVPAKRALITAEHTETENGLEKQSFKEHVNGNVENASFQNDEGDESFQLLELSDSNLMDEIQKLEETMTSLAKDLEVQEVEGCEADASSDNDGEIAPKEEHNISIMEAKPNELGTDSEIENEDSFGEKAEQPISNSSKRSSNEIYESKKRTRSSSKNGTHKKRSSGSPAFNQSFFANGSSEEESDIDSLRSYHPPVLPVDVPSAVRLAKRLYQLDGFKKTDVARHLSKNTEYNIRVAKEYCKHFNFEFCTLDNALRTFLSRFCLTGETQERERILYHFSKRYVECNPHVLENTFGSQDAVHTLTCAIMLLNTDLHCEHLSTDEMTQKEFIDNLDNLNDGNNFPKTLLQEIYVSIKNDPIPYDVQYILANSEVKDGNAIKKSSKTSDQGRKRSKGHESNVTIGEGAVGGINPFLTLPDPKKSKNYKNGYLMRKACIDPYGKKTKLGKRSWKTFYVQLRDMVLYCFKDEKSSRQPKSFADPHAAIRIHHGLAVKATDYTKKQFVFRLYTPDRAEYLFQASDEAELLTWIDVINHVIAISSAPQLAAGVSSCGKFQRPLLPSGPTNLSSIQEQLSSHEQKLSQLREELQSHLENPILKSSGNRNKAALADYDEKTQYLKFEIMRYETYILTMRTKNSQRN